MAQIILRTIQGIIAGASLLAVGLGFLYAASLNSAGVQFSLNGTVVEIQGSVPTATAIPTQTPIAQVVDQSVVAQSVEETPLATDEMMDLSPLPPLPADARYDYYSEVAPDLSVIIVSLGRLMRLLENPRADEVGWRSDVLQLIDMVHLGYERLLAVQPSAGAADLHAFLIQSTERCITATDPLYEDLTQIPSDLFPLVSRTLTLCIEDTKQVIQQIQ